MIKYSILMLTHNRLDAVQRCIDSLASTMERRDVMTWIFDNGSDIETQDYITSLQCEKHMKVNITLNMINHGVALGRASLLRQRSDSEYIVFLDSDTVIIDADWLDQLGGFLDEHEEVGLVGPGGSFVLPDFSQFTAAMPDAPCDVVAGYCQMFRASLLEMGLYIDIENYPGFWAEDSAFCMQIRELGWDCYCLPVGVQHNSSHSGYGQDMKLHAKHLEVFRQQWQGKGLTKAEGAY